MEIGTSFRLRICVNVNTQKCVAQKLKPLGNEFRENSKLLAFLLKENWSPWILLTFIIRTQILVVAFICFKIKLYL